MWSLFNPFSVSNRFLILKNQPTFDAIATYRAVVVWRGWWTAQLELDVITYFRWQNNLNQTAISGARRNTSTVRWKCYREIADPGPMAYRAIDGVAPEKCWKTKKYSFQARTRRGDSSRRIKEEERYKNPRSYLKLLSQQVRDILKLTDSYIVLLSICSPSIKTLTLKMAALRIPDMLGGLSQMAAAIHPDYEDVKKASEEWFRR